MATLSLIVDHGKAQVKVMSLFKGVTTCQPQINDIGNGAIALKGVAVSACKGRSELLRKHLLHRQVVAKYMHGHFRHAVPVVIDGCRHIKTRWRNRKEIRDH